MRIEGRGEIAIWEGGSLWVLAAERERAGAAAHSHHAVQATFSLEGSMALESGGEHIAGRAAAVAADSRHVFTASGRVAFLFVEPESPAGRALAAKLFRGRSLAPLDTREVEDLLAELAARAGPGGAGSTSLAELGKALVERIACTCRAALLDPRVEAMIAHAAANLDKPVALASATASIGLSQSRLRHLFVEETGLAFKTYVLWLRIRRAVELYADGASLTQAAHDSGFADSAHFSRTFRRTFGVPAAALKLTRAAGSSLAEASEGKSRRRSY